METMLEAIARLRAAGYPLDFAATPGARLRCVECGESIETANVTIDELVRFEGNSNPDDESILIAITTPSGHRGLYSSAYGTYTPPDDAQVLRALAR